MIRPDRAVAGAVASWDDADLKLLELIVRMMEIDPTFVRLERVFRRGSELIARLRAEEEGGSPECKM